MYVCFVSLHFLLFSVVGLSVSVIPKDLVSPRLAEMEWLRGCGRGLLVQVLLWGWVWGSELTFELPDNAKQCFYEDITIGTKCTLEFQVRLDM